MLGPEKHCELLVSQINERNSDVVEGFPKPAPKNVSLTIRRKQSRYPSRTPPPR
jgi:hypothetical protein